ncbi:hypothetical protein OPQ81_001235 [Rhizoctonia solani]|nr:hypothetical protein OPQ81_001235 [Rhizoctonia solani]
MSHTLLEQTLNSEAAKTALELAAKAKEHPIGVALGTLGLLGAHAFFKSIKNSRAFNNIDGPESPSFLRGHVPQVFDTVHGEKLQADLLKNYGTMCRLKGLLGVRYLKSLDVDFRLQLTTIPQEDQLWTADPRAMHEIVIKEVDSFRLSDNFLSWIKVTTGENLITVHGQKHKLQRKLLNPVFTPNHMRDLVPTFGGIANHLEDIFMNKVQQGGGASAMVDIFKWLNYGAFEMIGQAGMGHSFDIMEGKESSYLKAADRFFPITFELWYIRPLLPRLMKIGSKSFRRFVVDHTPLPAVKELREIARVLDDVAVDIYNRKKEAAANGTLDAQVAAGKDIMTSLLRQNELMPPGEQMSEEDLIGQVNGFVFAGSDTTSSALARTIHLLALHPDVQDTLRAEVSEAFKLYGSDLDYGQLNSLTYLDAVCREMLRLHPPVLFVERIAQKNCVLPLQYPVKARDGKTMITEVPIKKGTNIYVSIIAANRDKQTWGEDADEFKPSRWLQELPSAVQESKIPGVYANIMTFSGGPRSCIGFRFTQLEMKVVLTKLINAFRFDLGEQQICWSTDGVSKPYVRHADGTHGSHGMPMKISMV